MPACKFTKKTLLPIFFHIFCLHFLRKRVRAQFLSAESSITCNLPVQHDSFKRTIFTIFLLNMSFEVLLSAVSCNIKLFALCFDRYFFYQNLIILHHGDTNFLF